MYSGGQSIAGPYKIPENLCFGTYTNTRVLKTRIKSPKPRQREAKHNLVKPT